MMKRLSIIAAGLVVLLVSLSSVSSAPLRREVDGQIVGRTDIIFPDNAAKDAFSRLRVSEPFGTWVNKNITSSNRNQWESKISGVVVVYNTLVGGPFQIGEQIRGTLPARYIALGTITADTGAALTLDVDHNDFQVGDTITGQTSGATAVVVSTDTGSDIKHNYNEAAVEIRAGPLATDYAIRQTHRYHSYVPGKSQLVIMTGVVGSPKANAVKRVGLFDDLDGLFLEQTSEGAFIVKRTSTSGSPVDIRIPQSSWNLDRLDGSEDEGNPSRFNLDLTKAQIFIIDFQWLGVGRVRMGFDIDGDVVYVHEFLHANILDVVYMRTATLPIRYEVRNTGIPSSPTTVKEICSSVSSEGGFIPPGLELTVSNPIAGRSIAARTPVLALRLKGSFPAGKPNRRVLKFLDADTFTSTNDARFEIAHVHEPIDITATWTDVGGGSAAEYSTNITTVTGRPEHIIGVGDKGTGVGNKGQGGAVSGEYINLHSFVSQGIDSGPNDSEMFIVYATPHTGTALIRTSIKWVEFE